MDTYFKFKMYTEYIIPIVLLVILFVVVIICIAIGSVKEKMINKFFLSHGYERRLLDVSSVGAKAFYGWVRESDYKVADDRDIKSLSLKQIKEKYK